MTGCSVQDVLWEGGRELSPLSGQHCPQCWEWPLGFQPLSREVGPTALLCAANVRDTKTALPSLPLPAGCIPERLPAPGCPGSWAPGVFCTPALLEAQGNTYVPPHDICDIVQVLQSSRGRTILQEAQTHELCMGRQEEGTEGPTFDPRRMKRPTTDQKT